jgi:hypothetical protein
MQIIYALTVRCKRPPSVASSPFGYWRTYHFANEGERQAFLDGVRPHIFDVSMRVETLFTASEALQHWRSSQVKRGVAE